MRRLFWAVLILSVGGFLLTGLTLVRPGERAVVRRFGRVLEHKPEPGLWVGLPRGMDRVDRVPVDRVQEVQVGYRDGFDAGRNDARDRNRFDPVRSKRYRDGDHDYNNRYGDCELYKRDYRAAFEQGYREGYGTR